VCACSVSHVARQSSYEAAGQAETIGCRVSGCGREGDPMVMPLAGRAVAAVIGGLLVLTSVSSLIGTLVVTRSVGSRLTRLVDRTVDGAYQLLVSRVADPRRRDQLLATQAAAILLGQ